jgi:Na+/H+ antiporter NhaD/arsenite permease-like protein
VAGTHTTAADGLAFGASVPTGFTRTVADVNTAALLLAVDIMATDLDVDGGFDWFTVFIEGDNVNNACLISAWAILYSGRFHQNVPLSAIS